jgi:hypothetical protein
MNSLISSPAKMATGKTRTKRRRIRKNKLDTKMKRRRKTGKRVRWTSITWVEDLGRAAAADVTRVTMHSAIAQSSAR